MDEAALAAMGGTISETLQRRYPGQVHLLIFVDPDTGASSYTANTDRDCAILVLRELLSQLEGN